MRKKRSNNCYEEICHKQKPKEKQQCLGFCVFVIGVTNEEVELQLEESVMATDNFAKMSFGTVSS